MGVGRWKLLQYVINFQLSASDFQFNICFDVAQQALKVEFLIRIYAKKNIRNENFT
ncbi:hypothetical protein [Chryseobacterium sp. Tr-659]|uniref:hypothetical protein n=1 Tax=Chryseobacterium sp. Tr-659 TaxID=2608340 RepID=UPI00141EC027|nr:hypothetical protein [Chryseobacterium sp. Tr-659]